jgi:hypothetical protein
LVVSKIYGLSNESKVNEELTMKPGKLSGS